MQVLSVDPVLLRGALPDLVLREGTRLHGRVLELGPHGKGLLLLAGVPLAAKLPPGIEAGATLNLRVQEATGDQVLLQIAPAAAQLAAPPPALRTAQGGEVRIEGQGAGRRGGPDGDEDRGSVAIAFSAPALGRLDLRLTLDAGGVRVHVGAAAGVPFEQALADAEALRAAIAERTGRPALVRVDPRRDPVDLYA